MTDISALVSLLVDSVTYGFIACLIVGSLVWGVSVVWSFFKTVSRA